MNNLEHRIKNRLENYGSEIDPYEIWDGIQEKRNKKKKRILGFIWLAASLFILISTLTLGYISFSKSQSQTINNPDSNNTTLTNNINKNHNFNTNEKNQTTLNKDKKYSNNISLNNVAPKQKQIVYNAKNLRSNNLNNIDHPKRKNRDAYRNKKTDFIGLTTKYENNIIKSSKIMTHIDSETSFDKVSKPQRRFSDTYLLSNLIPITYERQDLALNFIPLKNKKTRKIFFNKKPTPELSFTANYIHDSYVLTLNNSNTFMQNVKNNEKQLEAFDIYLLYDIPLSKNFSINTGLNYGQIDSKLDFTYKESKEVVLDSVLTKVVYKSLTDTLRIYERARTTGEFKVHDIKYNYRRYLRIPVLVTYSSKIKSVKYNIRTGVDLNLLTCNNAKTITSDGKTVALNDTDRTLRKTGITGDFHFDLRFSYDLTRHVLLTAGPQYKLSLSSLMRNDAGFALYRHSIGLNIGARYKI